MGLNHGQHARDCMRHTAAHILLISRFFQTRQKLFIGLAQLAGGARLV